MVISTTINVTLTLSIIKCLLNNTIDSIIFKFFLLSLHEIILHALMKIEKAILTLQERTKFIKCADDFCCRHILP